MTTSPTKFSEDNLQIKAIELDGVSKKYHFTKDVKADFDPSQKSLTLSPGDECKLSSALGARALAFGSPALTICQPSRVLASRQSQGKSRDSSRGSTDFLALKEISMDIYKGQVVGIIGRNGAGKTTLLNIIAGVLTPSEGKILVNGKALGLFNLGVGFQDELSGRENIFLNGAILGVDRKEIEEKLGSIIEFSELGNFIGMPLGTYSQGMRLRLGFSIIANLDFDILVIDEVLAVGDALFQSKCYERLVDFRRLGRTLIVTSQDMAIIERLCDEVLLLDHGLSVFKGNPQRAIDRYKALLNTEKFFVGPVKHNETMVENTKKWADDKSDWGKKLGTKEIVIDSVEFINRFGFRIDSVKTREFLKIKVSFTVKNRAKDLHFGVAIFREDGVYCYGPNTGYDGYNIHELKPGKGYFALEYRSLLLAPGEYRVSVAIWDKNEKIAYDYHNAFYKLVVKGYKNAKKEVLNIPYVIAAGFSSDDLELKTFITNQPLKIKMDGSLELYRDDGILCQYINLPIRHKNKHYVYFPKMPLLPGKYFAKNDSGDYPFNFIFNRQDHGTIYLDHKWSIKIRGK